MSQESTFATPEVDRLALEERLASLAARVEDALVRERLAAKRVVVKLRYADGELITRSVTGVHAMVAARELFAQALPLLDRTQAGSRPVRGVGLIAGELGRARRDDRQLDLFGRRCSPQARNRGRALLKRAVERSEEPLMAEGARMRNERRKYARVSTDQVISFSMLDHTDQLAVGKDISQGGIRFQAIGCELEFGDRIRVTFNVGERTLEAVGQVMWATELDAVTYDIGLAFESLDPEAARLLDELSEE